MFSEYIKLTGRGEKGRRSLTQQEAYDALTSYLNGDADLLQLAVLLMLQRVRCETPQEAAGYIQALRDTIAKEWHTLDVDLDWPCFAGKKRQPPWLLLAAKVLAQQGKRIVLHGFSAVDALKFQIEAACPALNIQRADTPEQARQILMQSNICYLPLSAYCPKLVPLLALREKVGLRTPLNTVARSLNPTSAPFAIHGVFHKGYEKLHAQAALLTGEVNMIAFKGEGGESEINPRVSSTVCGVKTKKVVSSYFEEEWPTYLEQTSGAHTEVSADYLLSVWSGEVKDEYGDAAVICTLALLLKQFNSDATQQESIQLAKQYWHNRNKNL
ncbi:glycosyl transferase family protein [Psychromonas antarctica]|jgi:anthranilate phosphoribosyltransferase|uniref:glycosyl transferase family protein n=1 Tax=Psychromonas antarctica TaxID=67573 RepID=UPI001EE9052A|nr:glycosyl transferase family protein [Psychromonas antarctica]MCG6200484.1 glycosyl transferase family protein [Psychromonas antarctica]